MQDCGCQLNGLSWCFQKPVSDVKCRFTMQLYGGVIPTSYAISAFRGQAARRQRFETKKAMVLEP